MAGKILNATSRKIEERRRADQVAVAGKLALELMHEIKNPLDALGNLAYLTLKDSENGELVRRYMQLAEEQLATVCRIVSQSLSMAGSTSVRRREALHLLVESALRIHQKSLDAKQIHLVKNLTEDLVAEVHAGELVQVFSNLIANSLDAMPSNGTLKIHLKEDSNGVCISISDTGHGIPAAKAKHVFKPFYTTKGGSGTGLGLHISKKIVEGHQGTISIKSSARPGRSGTTFTISLPVKQNRMEQGS